MEGCAFFYTMVSKIKIRVAMPTTVVKRPTCLDFVHPAQEITTVRDNNPTMKVAAPMVLGSAKSAATTFFQYPPGVVIIAI